MTPVFPCVLDHLVIGARSLEEGRSFVADLLGVSPVAGGTHPNMGTHNVLLSLGGSVYLEVIAVDPEAEPPDRPRWFSLDNPKVRQALEQGPAVADLGGPHPGHRGAETAFSLCDVRRSRDVPR